MREKKIFWVIVFNLVIIVSEIGFGLLSNSFALIADALHNIGDVIAVAISYLALRLASQKASFRYPFGFMRAEMMAGFVNTLFLFLTMFYMLYLSVGHFLEPEQIEPLYMITVGFVALVANGVSAYILNTLGVESCSHGNHHDESHHHEGHHPHQDVNIRSAYLHMFADALISLGVVLAGVAIYFFDIYRVDAVLTMGFSVFILFHSYPLLKKSFLSLMDINTVELDKEKIENVLLSDANVQSYHSLHIRQPSSLERCISMHLVLNDATLTLSNQENIRQKIETALQHLGFTQIIMQLEPKGVTCTSVK